ncbi:MAG: MATE family efflux transporter [Pelagibacteraceae bacterium]
MFNYFFYYWNIFNIDEKSTSYKVIEYFFEPSIEIQNLIKKYISVRIFSAPAELAMYALVGFYLGLQKTKISSLMISTFCLTNIIFSTYFVLALNLEVYGVALGTLLSSYLTTIVFLIYTKYFIKKKFDIIPKFKKIFIRKKIFKLLYINLNIFIRTLLLTFAFLYFTFQSSKLGVDFLATNAILLQFVILASFFLDAYAFSTESVVGFSIGRNIKKTFLHVVNNCFQLSFFTSLIISIIYLIFYKLFINFLTNLEYIRYLAYGFSFWIILIPPIASFCYQFDGIFIGSSLTAEMRNSMIISLFLFILISDFLVKYFNNNGLWLSLIIFMILRSLTLNFYFSNILKKFK